MRSDLNEVKNLFSATVDNLTAYNRYENFNVKERYRILIVSSIA